MPKREFTRVGQNPETGQWQMDFDVQVEAKDREAATELFNRVHSAIQEALDTAPGEPAWSILSPMYPVEEAEDE